MQMPIIPSIPSDLELSLAEFKYLENIQESVYQILNDKHPESQIMDSDHLLCFIIILCRHNKYYPKRAQTLIPSILAINTQNPTLN
jgi:hypothetical protein